MSERDFELVRASIEQIGDRSTALSKLFYTRLFQLDPSLSDIFDGGVAMLNRKFVNMLLTFKSAKGMEKLRPALESMAKRHVGYRAAPRHFLLFRDCLLESLAELLGDEFTPDLRAAWEALYDEVAGIMTAWMQAHPEVVVQASGKGKTHVDLSLLEEIGGEEVVRNVHQRFYDFIYNDDYIGQFFFHRARELVVTKQTQFMVAAFGGPNNYKGEPPAFLHMHMYITQEMADIRNIYLQKAILGEGLSEAICERWMRVDNAFLPAIVKESVDECVMRVWGQGPFVIKRPAIYIPLRL
jgi:nitric oxide dioxygenase